MIEKIEAEAAEQAAAEEQVVAAEEKVAAAAAAAMKMNRIVSYQQGSHFGALCGGCVCKDSETKKMVIVRSSFWSSFWAAFHFPIFEVCSFCAWYLLFLAHSFWMFLEASFRADINLLDECLQIQKSGKHVYQKSSFFV